VKKVTLKLQVNEDRMVLYSTVVAFDKLGVDPMVLVNKLMELIPAGDEKLKQEFTDMALAVIDSIHPEEG